MKVKKGDYTIAHDPKKLGKENDNTKIKKPEPKPQKEKIKEKIKEIVNRASNRGTGGGGGGSTALRREIEKASNPQINWRKILERYVSQANEEATLYKIPNRRFVSSDLYLPGLRGKEEGFGAVVLAVDTSGSIGSDEYNRFLAETRQILKAFRPEETWIIYCSDQIDGIDYLKSPSQPLDKTKQGSTGGNACGFDPPIEWAEQNILKKGKEIACLIYFTDGGAHRPKKPKWDKKIIWAVTKSKTATMGFGKHVYIPIGDLE